jgi:hypothetical protein
MDHGHTLMQRAHTSLDEWAEEEHLKGSFALVGALWSRHPSWGSDPQSDSYLDNRWAWHQNLGELLNFHGTAHIRNQNVNGVAKKILVVTLSHPDTGRLEAIKVVTGGSGDAHPGGGTRLRVENRAAALLIKAGRMFIDYKNTPLMDILTAAGRFYTHIPAPGQGATDPELAGQETEETHLIPLLATYRALRVRIHDCQKETLASGGGPRVYAKRFL